MADKKKSPNSPENDDSELYIAGRFRQLVEEGLYELVCFDYQLLPPTRFNRKHCLYWAPALDLGGGQSLEEEESWLALEQFFNYREKYTANCKPVKNYLAALGKRPKRLDRFSLQSLVGLRAIVSVETVKGKYSSGVLAEARAESPSNSYSKVSEIVEPVGRVASAMIEALKERFRRTL
jgi:hypothetical protein